MPPADRPVKPAPIFRLWVMMFLQFFIWGAWLPLIFGYLPTLGFTAWQQTIILNAFPVSAILAIFFSNPIADRLFPAERFMAFSSLIAAISIGVCGFVTSFWPFCIGMWIHCFFYAPTISMASSIAFNALSDPKRDFGRVRVGGTIGWVVASWPMAGLIGGSVGPEITYIIAAIAAFCLAAFSLLLPHTPARRSARHGLSWLGSFRHLAKPAISVLWIVTMLDAALRQWYYNWTDSFLQQIGIAENWVMPLMSIGQVSEIAAMAMLGYFLSRLGWKPMLMMGIAAQLIRFLVFALLPLQSTVILVHVLHGFCYTFFFATVYIYINEVLPRDARSSTQGMFNLMSLGVGPLIANSFAPALFANFTNSAGVTDFRGLFLIPIATAIATLFILGVAFQTHADEPPVAPETPSV